MLRQGKQPESWEYATEPCGTGKSKGKLQQSEQQGDREDMTLPHIQLGLPGIGLSSSMPESPQQSKKKICSVNVNVRLVPIRSL